MIELKAIDNWPIPIVLVGKLIFVLLLSCVLISLILFSPATKVDLRQNLRKPLVSTEEGAELGHKIYANRFIECSAKENVHIKDVVHEAVRASVQGPLKVEEDEPIKRFSFIKCCQSI